MTVEGVSWGLKLGCWESRQPQNKPEMKFDRSLEVVFLGCMKVRTSPAESPPFPDICGDEWDRGRRGLRCRGICKVIPETSIFLAFSVEIHLYRDALAPDAPQGIEGSQRILFMGSPL